MPLQTKSEMSTNSYYKESCAKHRQNKKFPNEDKKLFYLRNWVLGAVRFHSAIDVYLIRGFCACDHPYVARQLVRRQLHRADAGGVAGSFILPHRVGASLQWPYSHPNEGSNDLHTRKMME